MLRIILEIYIGISLFSAGFMMGQSDSTLLGTILYLFFGPFLIIGEILKMWLSGLMSLFQVRFFWRFIILGKYRDESVESLKKFNDSVKKYNSSDSLKDRIYRLCTRMINKRNNYSPSNEKP